MTPELEVALQEIDDGIDGLSWLSPFKEAAVLLAAEIRRRDAATCETCVWGHPRYGTPDEVLFCGMVAQQCAVPLPCSYFGNTCGAWTAKP